MSLQRISFAEACAFSRAGEATFFGSNGLLQTAAAGVPRLDYDPVTLAPKGILIEGTRTNLFVQSANLTVANWAKANCTIVADAVAAPDGAVTASKIAETSAVGTHGISQSVTVVGGDWYTLTGCAQKEERSLLRVGNGDRSIYAVFDLNAGTVQHMDSGITASIKAIGGGRYKFSISLTALASGSSTFLFRVQSATSEYPGAGTYTGTTGFGLYVWGLSICAGHFASSYTPTTTMAVTRTADILTVQPAQFAAAFRQDAGTILIDMTLNHTGLTATGANDFPSLLDMDSAAAPGDGYSVLASAGYGPGYQINVRTGGTDVAGLTFAKALGGGSRTKLALSWGGANDFAACMDGGAVATDTSGAIPTPDRLSIGCQNGANAQMFGHVRKVLFFPQRLTNAQLQEATTL